MSKSISQSAVVAIVHGAVVGSAVGIAGATLANALLPFGTVGLLASVGVACATPIVGGMAAEATLPTTQRAVRKVEDGLHRLVSDVQHLRHGFRQLREDLRRIRGCNAAYTAGAVRTDWSKYQDVADQLRAAGVDLH